MNSATSPPAMLAWMSSLADSTRVRALRLVERHELTVAELCTVLQAPQSTVSRHLKVLADDGWVQARAEGTSRLYRMSIEQLDPAARRLWALLREQVAATAPASHDDRRLEAVLAGRQTRSQAFFSSAAGQWDRLRGELFGDRFDLVALGALLDERWTVGDLGCGTGQIAECLAPHVARVIAVESSRAMLRAARARLSGLDNVELHQGTLEALPIDDGSLDAAVICLVLHHVCDPPAVLREAARVLRPEGRLLVIDMFRHERTEYQRQMGHVWLGFDELQLAGWLTEAGFLAPRARALPSHPAARGPALLAASARRAASNPDKGHPVRNGAPQAAETADISSATAPHGPRRRPARRGRALAGVAQPRPGEP